MQLDARGGSVDHMPSVTTHEEACKGRAKERWHLEGPILELHILAQPFERPVHAHHNSAVRGLSLPPRKYKELAGRPHQHNCNQPSDLPRRNCLVHIRCLRQELATSRETTKHNGRCQEPKPKPETQNPLTLKPRPFSKRKFKVRCLGSRGV